MKRIFLSFLLLGSMMALYAQTNNDVLVRIGKESVTVDEFLNAYQKNNTLSEATEKDLREYLDLYINYRMKVQEATALKMDTSAQFKNELASYQTQSAQQYLVDTEVSDHLLEEAFQNSKFQVRASHILVRCSQTASPKDTLAAYHKIMQIRDKIVKGMDFNEAAYLYSEDESAQDHFNPQNGRKQYGNKGELGYFSVLEMIYPFEKAAFSLPVGQVSMPVRTQYGYHLIYVKDKMPAVGKIFVSQVFVQDTNAMAGPPKGEIADRLRLIQDQYKSGKMSFEDLAKNYSDDKATKNQGGKMEPFTPNRRPGNYVAAALKLNKGEISDPIPSNLGWHILRRDSVVKLFITEDSKYMLKSALARDSRARTSRESLVNRLKKEYNFQEGGKAAAMKFFKKNVPDNYFQSTATDITRLKGIEKLKPMFTFADQTGSATEFAQYVSRYQGTPINGAVIDFIQSLYPGFVTEKIIRYEKLHLSDKYPEYRDLVKEFHDGMLLYEINSQKVWNAAIQDSVGIENYYEVVKKDYTYLDSTGAVSYKPLKEIRAVVIGRYQDYLEAEWIKELRNKYPVTVDEKVFKAILKK